MSSATVSSRPLGWISKSGHWIWTALGLNCNYGTRQDTKGSEQWWQTSTEGQRVSLWCMMWQMRKAFSTWQAGWRRWRDTQVQMWPRWISQIIIDNHHLADNHWLLSSCRWSLGTRPIFQAGWSSMTRPPSLHLRWIIFVWNWIKCWKASPRCRVWGSNSYQQPEIPIVDHTTKSSAWFCHVFKSSFTNSVRSHSWRHQRKAETMLIKPSLPWRVHHSSHQTGIPENTFSMLFSRMLLLIVGGSNKTGGRPEKVGRGKNGQFWKSETLLRSWRNHPREGVLLVCLIFFSSCGCVWNKLFEIKGYPSLDSVTLSKSFCFYSDVFALFHL